MIVPGYDRFGGRSPETAPLTNVLHALGLNYSEEMVFGLAGGIGASYFVFEYKGMPPNVFLGMRHGLYGSPDFLGAACRRIGATPVFKETTSKAAAHKHLLEAMAAGKPAVAYVCGKEQYTYHHVGVAGIEGEEVLLDDMAPAPVRMSLEQFGNRRAAIGSFKNRLLTVTQPHGKIDLAPGILDGIRATVRGMHESPIKSFASNFGLASLEKFAILLGDEKDKRGWAKQFPPGPKLECGLKWIHLYTKNGAYRGMFADFLDEAAKVTKRKSLSSCAEQYRRLEQRWKEFAETSLAENQPKLAELSAAMRRLHGDETIACASLDEAVS